MAILRQFVADKTDKALPAIVGALGDPDGIVVFPAVHELGRRRSATTFAVMVQLASSQINKGGWETMYEMQRYPYSLSRAFFKEHWNTPDPIARKFLTGALGMKAEPEEFWTIVRRTMDEPSIQWEAGYHLHRYREPRFQRALLALLDHPDVRVQQSAALALGMAGAKFAIPVLERKARSGAQEVRWPATEALLRLK